MKKKTKLVRKAGKSIALVLLEDKINELSKDKAYLQREVRTLKEDNQSLEKELSELKSTVKDKLKKLQEETECIRQLRHQLGDFAMVLSSDVKLLKENILSIKKRKNV